MADESGIPKDAPLGEVANVTLLDIGAAFADELRVANDDILRAKGGDLVIYEKVLRDEQCYSTFKQLRTDIISRETRIEPGGDRPIDIAAAEDMRLQLARFGWDAATKKMLMGLWVSFSVGECMYSVEGTHIWLDELRVRKARRFRFDKDGRLRLIRTNNVQGSVMPDAKFWVFRADADDDDDPYPLGLGYYCYWPVWFKRNMMRFWSLWGEKFASPTPIAKFPPGAGETERKKALSLAQKVMSGAAMAVPTNVMLELLEALARAGDDYERFCKYVDAAVTKIILCQTMTTDNGSSLSQSQTHAEVKEAVSKTYADLICESFMRGPATWLTTWNFPGAAVPRIYRDYSESEDLKLAAERDERLNNIGYRPTTERIADVYGDGYEPVTAEPAGDAPVVDGQPTQPQASFSEGESRVVGPADAALDRLLDNDGWREVLGPEVDAVQQFVDGASSLEEIRDRLGTLANRDPAAITESLARVMFAASIAGRVEADIDAD